MIFSSFQFIYLFLPTVFVGYFLLNHLNNNTASKIFLAFASFFFYAMGSPVFFRFFFASVILNFLCGSYVARTGGVKCTKNILRKFIFVVAVLANVALLGYFKYTDFFISNYNFLFGADYPLLHIALPIGISFFTFQLIAFQVDAYRDGTKISDYSFLDYLLFITFFPQLIVGPIVHHSEVVPQFADEKKHHINWENISRGLFVFTIGFAKKSLLADGMTGNAQSFFNAIPTTFGAASAWWYSIEYTLSYYFDLSAYADMAIGIGLLFNIVIPENFNSPYKARNFQDYWQRWHITLSRFLSEYIFRSVYRHGSKWRNYYTAVMVTFFVSGFWHGAGWTFVVWGLINGIFVCTASWMKRKGFAFPTAIAHSLTILGILFTRILFVSPTFNGALKIFKNMFNFSDTFFPGFGISPLLITRMIFSIVIIFFMPTTKKIAEKFSASWSRLIASCALAGTSVAYLGSGQSFLYFQF